MIRIIKHIKRFGSVYNEKERLSFPIFTTFIILFLFNVLIWVTIWPCPSLAAKDSFSYKGRHIAFSMRVMAQRPSSDLCGVSKIEGFLVDGKNKDIIVIGKQSGNYSPYHLDDLVVNMRHIWDKREPLYCSLDPSEEDVNSIIQILSENANVKTPEERRQVIQHVREMWGPQIISIGGVPWNSRHARIMIDTDYHMKQVSMDLIQLADIDSYLEKKASKTEEYLRKGKTIPASEITINRFWFHIKEGYPTFREAEDIVWLEASPIVLFTEKQNASQAGELYDVREDDPQAIDFAREFSTKFQQATKEELSYAELKNLYRLKALLEAIHFTRADSKSGLDMTFYLNGYIYQMESLMDESLPGLVNHKETFVTVRKGFKKYKHWSFPMIYGGVNMEMDMKKEKFKKDTKLNKMRSVVLSAKPSLDALFWFFMY